MAIAGAVAMGAYRPSIREVSIVAAGFLEMDIIDSTCK
jgi:hypothetical protein